MDEWFYVKDGQKRGPISTAQLRQLAASGELVPKDQIWREGLEGWVAASYIKGLPFSRVASSNQEAHALCGKPNPAPLEKHKNSNSLWSGNRGIIILCTVAILGVCGTIWYIVGSRKGQGTSNQPVVTIPDTRIFRPVQKHNQSSRKPRISPAIEKPTGGTIGTKKRNEDPGDLFRRLSPGVVRVLSRSSDGTINGQGTGFFIATDGVVVTNYHVIKNADRVDIVLQNNATFPLKHIKAISKKDDIAVLQVDAVDVPALKLASRKRFPVGTSVFAIGNPKGLVNTFSSGEISGIRDIPPRMSVIQCTTPISPGSSGGPLVAQDGSVIGITTFMFVGGQNLNFAIPAHRIQSILKSCPSPMKLSEVTGRSKAKAKRQSFEETRQMKGLPYEARISLVVSADREIRGLLEGYFRRELRKINNVVLTKTKPRWQISVVALPRRSNVNGSVVGYWMSIVAFQIRTHWDPKKPYQTSTSGAIVRHELIMRGANILEAGVKKFVVAFEGEIVEKNRASYEAQVELWRRIKAAAGKDVK